jgi:hypothetical protein
MLNVSMPAAFNVAKGNTPLPGIVTGFTAESPDAPSIPLGTYLLTAIGHKTGVAKNGAFDCTLVSPGPNQGLQVTVAPAHG